MVKLTKLKRLEKAKVKLRAKKLPKGQNVTNTAFKTRKIIIPGQLKISVEDEIRTRKRLNVQELLSHLKHYNTSMRREGLSGLKELITYHEDDILKLHLPKVIDGIASLILDLEKDIRKNALGLVDLLLTKVSAEQIVPHFHVLHTYMSCAMTHINHSIREDSLLLLDILLNTCPILMVEKANDILPIFMNMISNIKSGAESGRVLSVNLNNNLTTVRWRIKVLQRTTRYYSAIVASRNNETSLSKSSPVMEGEGNSSKVVTWTEDIPVYAGKFISRKIDVCHLPNLFYNTASSKETVGQFTVNQEETLKEHVLGLMPILLETWIEVSPQRDAEEVNLLSQEAAVMLQYVVETVQHVWDCLESWEHEADVKYLTEWFTRQYEKDILTHFIPGFPYMLQENVFSIKRLKQHGSLLPKEQSLLENKEALHPTCIQQNLCLCYLMTCIHNGKNKAVVKPVVSYVKSCLQKWDTPQFLPLFDKVLRSFVLKHTTSWPRTDVIRATMVKCQEKAAEKEFHQTLFHLLCDYLLLPGHHNELRIPDVEEWIAELPYILLQDDVSEKVVKALTVLVCQNNKVFMDRLQKRAKTIINSLFQLEVSSVSRPVECQKAIVNILFRVADSNLFDYMLKRISAENELYSYVQNLKTLNEFISCQT